MGYDLHITRADDWAQNDGVEITAEEWLALVRSDPELALEPSAGPYFARWSGPSRYPDPWLDWFEGNVNTKNPDSALLRKMVQIAARLGARVQGDDGELYTGDEPLDEYADAGDTQVSKVQSRSWWRRLMGR